MHSCRNTIIENHLFIIDCMNKIQELE